MQFYIPDEETQDSGFSSPLQKQPQGIYFKDQGPPR